MVLALAAEAADPIPRVFLGLEPSSDVVHDGADPAERQDVEDRRLDLNVAVLVGSNQTRRDWSIGLR
jgi:hypothetical protein